MKILQHFVISNLEHAKRVQAIFGLFVVIKLQIREKKLKGETET